MQRRSQPLLVYIASCCGSPAGGLYDAELRRLADLIPQDFLKIVDSPHEAGVILVVDIDESRNFRSVRRNDIWLRFPEKCFGIYEGDSPPRFLRGIYSSVPKSWAWQGRFQSGPYPMHRMCYPNPLPAIDPNRCRDLLFSFVGRDSHVVRRRLFQNFGSTPDVKVEDTTSYCHFSANGNERQRAQSRFWEVTLRSKYVLCPRGAGVSSIRLFEVLEAGIAPVIISDNWLPPLGPDWERFAIRVPERRVSDVYAIVRDHESEWLERGRAARQEYERWYSPSAYWHYLFTALDAISRNQRVSEAFYARLSPVYSLAAATRMSWVRFSLIGKSFAKSLIRRAVIRPFR